MKIVLVRDEETKLAVGVYCGDSLKTIMQEIDKVRDPYSAEYAFMQFPFSIGFKPDVAVPLDLEKDDEKIDSLMENAVCDDNLMEYITDDKLVWKKFPQRIRLYS